mmetsp:Transcript_11132/g.33380  ORF Transcript_11132/g.33380 Transcript_11132/m.33380 type:complete len:417 (-) Transcript_11132:418-1668(-)|eukprot:CAMPEP_0206137808 /NCGR_PEP_ID=MMETSP1473-20131121/2863_1 /ASSEMBLY_ACC=CAM_ASM_001109 /TAXON_ID=1461547 /ORGANISM="Stichococcus sp, Strain RCC1054" /LENGTH=416 /DNA_ID=CAMNT_0053531053 /DNA_START=207 /DNA_END=1457 /DNA_ORIENTATION=+
MFCVKAPDKSRCQGVVESCGTASVHGVTRAVQSIIRSAGDVHATGGALKRTRVEIVAQPLTSSILQLPDDVLRNILKFLNVRSKAEVQWVNRRFRGLLRDDPSPGIWGEVNLRLLANRSMTVPLFDSLINWLLAREAGISVISVRPEGIGVSSTTHSVMAAITSVLPETPIALQMWNLLEDPNPSRLFEDRHMMQVFTKQLSKLQFHSDGGQWSQLFQLTALQELCLTVVVPFHRAVGPPPTSYTTLPHLRCLKLQHSTADLSPLLLRCAMPGVTSLTITDCRISDGADLAALPMMAPALRELRLTWLTLAEAPPLVLPHLRVADLSRSSLPGTFWQQAPHAWPALQQLLLDGDAQAVSLDVVNMVEAMPRVSCVAARARVVASQPYFALGRLARVLHQRGGKLLLLEAQTVPSCL